MHKGSWGAFAADLIGQETDYMSSTDTLVLLIQPRLACCDRIGAQIRSSSCLKSM